MCRGSSGGNRARLAATHTEGGGGSSSGRVTAEQGYPAKILKRAWERGRVERGRAAPRAGAPQPPHVGDAAGRGRRGWGGRPTRGRPWQQKRQRPHRRRRRRRGNAGPGRGGKGQDTHEKAVGKNTTAWSTAQQGVARQRRTTGRATTSPPPLEGGAPTHLCAAQQHTCQPDRWLAPPAPHVRGSCAGRLAQRAPRARSGRQGQSEVPNDRQVAGYELYGSNLQTNFQLSPSKRPQLRACHLLGQSCSQNRASPALEWPTDVPTQLAGER